MIAGGHMKSLEQLRDELAEKEIFEFHGCFTGDCPHEKYSDCAKHFWDKSWGAAVQAIQEREKNARVLRLKPRYIKKRGSKGVYLFAGYDCASGSSITMDDPDVIYKVREVIE